MVMALVATTLAMPRAALASGDDQVCQTQDEHEFPVTENESTVTVTAPEGKVITGYCVKAGSFSQGNGPEYVEGLNATSVTFSHSSDKAISHYVVFYGDIDINNWEYADPTCNSLYVDFPDWVTPGAANHVNIRFSGNGQTFTLNWHTDGSWAPESTFVYADHPDWPAGLTVFTVEWVQVAETNYHWQGELECGEEDPEPVDPTASIVIECVVNNDYRISGSVTAGDKTAPDNRFYAYAAVDGDADDRLFTIGLDPLETKAFSRTQTLTPGDTVILSQGPLVEGGIVELADAVVPPACPVPPVVVDGKAVLSTECDAPIEGSVINTGTEGLTYVVTFTTTAGSVSSGLLGLAAGETKPVGVTTPSEGLTVKVDLFYGDDLLDSAEVTYPGECPDPNAQTAFATECEAGITFAWENTGNVDLAVTMYRDDIVVLTTVIDAGANGGWTMVHDSNNATGVFDAGQTGRVELSYGDDVIATTGNVVYAGACPIDPTGDISIKCFVDDLYDVVAEIDGGSVGVKWMIRIKGGGGIVTKGSVPAFDDATIFLPAKQLEQGLVLVLRAPDNGGKLDSVTVPTSCFAPVSDALIALDTECDAEAKGSITNTGETTLIGNVHINDEILPGDIEIAPGETEEFTLPAELLEEGDVVKLVASGPEDYEREQALTYPEPCPTTTTVPPTTTVVIETPTTVPTTTTTVPETTTTVPDTTTTAPDSDGTVTEAEVAEPVEQTPTFTG